jgi:hypothetical protein
MSQINQTYPMDPTYFATSRFQNQFIDNDFFIVQMVMAFIPIIIAKKHFSYQSLF